MNQTDFQGWANINLFNRIPLNSESKTVNVLFSELRYLSEIDSTGLQYVQSKHPNIQNPQKTYSCFKAYLRQGMSFYKSAMTLEYKSSPLLFYYSFINFVKALICIKDPSLDTENIHHGLTRIQPPFTNFTDEKIKINNGIFEHFYKISTNSLIKHGVELNITNLMGYITQIGRECQKINIPTSSFAGSSKLLVNKSSKIFSLLVSFRQLDENKFKSTFYQNFKNNFSSHNLSWELESKVFNRFNPSRDHFFIGATHPWTEDQKVDITPQKLDLEKILLEFSEPVPYNHEDLQFFSFYPYNSNHGEVLFNETLAIYTIMFYLGSLVRYNPEYMEKIATTEYNWILESFIHESSVLFLRKITSNILDENIYVVRN